MKKNDNNVGGGKYTIIELILKPLHSSTQAYFWKGNCDLKISTTISTKHPLPTMLYGLLVPIGYSLEWNA
jgi:hypothetical protein